MVFVRLLCPAGLSAPIAGLSHSAAGTFCSEGWDLDIQAGFHVMVFWAVKTAAQILGVRDAGEAHVTG